MWEQTEMIRRQCGKTRLRISTIQVCEILSRVNDLNMGVLTRFRNFSSFKVGREHTREKTPGKVKGKALLLYMAEN